MLSAIAIFCEDIREEKQGTSTLVGVFSDNINVPAFPFAIPKLAIFLRINFPTAGRSPSEITVSMTQFDRDEEAFTIIGSELIEKSKLDAIRNNAAITGMVTKAVIANYGVERPGRVTLRISNAEVDFICGSLNFGQKPISDPSAL